MIADVAVYFSQGCGRCARFGTPDCSVHLWADGLTALRAICLSAGLVETAKWGHPCYMAGGRNVALIGALRGDFRISFFHASLLADPEGVLERAGPNAQHPDTIRFADAAQVARHEPAIRALLMQAIAHAKAGKVAPKLATAPDLPAELVTALDADPVLAEAFHRLTPGRQRSHAIQVSGAKQAATRVARIEKLRDRILAGKGATER